MTTATRPAAIDTSLLDALVRRDGDGIRAALPAATLLLPADPDQDGRMSARVASTDAGDLYAWAFTDPEAFRAWDLRPALGVAAVSGAQLLAIGGPAMTVVINAAGPAAFVLVIGGGQEPGGAASAAARPAAEPELPGAHPLPRPPARQALRRQARESHAAARVAVERADLGAAIAHLERALAACTGLGDRLHGAAVERELAGCHARRGDIDYALGWASTSIETFELLGEPELADATRRDAERWERDRAD